MNEAVLTASSPYWRVPRGARDHVPPVMYTVLCTPLACHVTDELTVLGLAPWTSGTRLDGPHDGLEGRGQPDLADGDALTGRMTLGACRVAQRMV